MTGNATRHPSVANARSTHILTCGCASYGPGHDVHWIQARLFSRCRPEEITGARLESWEGNHLTVTIGGERRVGWHANPEAVATFCTIAEQAALRHTAFFGRSSLLATSNGEVSALVHLDFTGAGKPCLRQDGEPRPQRGATGPALVWLDRATEE